jgi:WD40 repeat protein
MDIDNLISLFQSAGLPPTNAINYATKISQLVLQKQNTLTIDDLTTIGIEGILHKKVVLNILNEINHQHPPSSTSTPLLKVAPRTEMKFCTPKCIASNNNKITHTNAVRGVCFSNSPYPEMIVSVSNDYTTKVWSSKNIEHQDDVNNNNNQPIPNDNNNDIDNDNNNDIDNEKIKNPSPHNIISTTTTPLYPIHDVKRHDSFLLCCASSLACTNNIHPISNKLTIRIVSGDMQGVLVLWDTNTWTNISTNVDADPIYALIFTPSGNEIICAGRRGDVFLLDGFSPNNDEKRKHAKIHASCIYTLSINLNGDLVASGSDARDVCIFSVYDLEIKHRFQASGYVYALTWLYYDDTSLLYSVYVTKGEHKVLNEKTGKIIKSFESPNPCYAVSVSHDFTVLAGGSSNGEIYLWMLPNFEFLHVLNGSSTLTIHRSIRALQFSPFEPYLVVGGDDQGIQVIEFTAQ